jgi:hypothetical protein
MRPVTVEHIVSQYFASMPTQGVAADSRPSSGVGYYVWLYGNYQPFGHAGMDFACPIGTRVHAMADGVVLYAGWGYNLPGAGNVRKWLLYKDFPGIVTVIQHPGWIGVYAHLSDNDMAPAGTTVRMGQLIALSGNTGGVAPHLHVEALVDLTYKTGGGLIYGRADPSKFFGSGLAAQGSTTVQEDDMAQVSQEAWDGLAGLVGSLVDNVATKADLDKQAAKTPGQVWSYQNPGLGGGDAFQILRDALASTNRIADTVAAAAAKAAAGGADEEAIKGAVKEAITELLIAGAGK